MSGILAVIGKGQDPKVMQQLSSRMQYRGNAKQSIKVLDNGSVLCCENSLIEEEISNSELSLRNNSIGFILDGTIYNKRQLIDGILSKYNVKSANDAELIFTLYKEFGCDFCNMLDGDWSFIIIDGDSYMVGRDPLGVKPLYYGLDDRGRIYFSSEMKAISDLCRTLSTFPPGHYYTSKRGFVRYFQPSYDDIELANQPLNLDLIRETFIDAVSKRLQSTLPTAVLLSGGLDSSLIAAIAARKSAEVGQKLKTYSIGLHSNSPDHQAAAVVSKYLNTDHHHLFFSVVEGIKILEKVIFHIETYDLITVRASVPLFLLSQEIAKNDIKVLLSGEGADEIFGGHLYFRSAPSSNDFQKEIVERVQKLHTADLLRVDKASMANGIAVLLPFLDLDFLENTMNIKTEFKQPKTYDGVEKYILRKAFDVHDDPYLPNEILWRQKEQFSDGVGYEWINELMHYCNSQVSDEEMDNADKIFVYNTPLTKEAYLYRAIFEKLFPKVDAAQTVRKWIPKWQDNLDPSGRANKAHSNAIEW